MLFQRLATFAPLVAVASRRVSHRDHLEPGAARLAARKLTGLYAYVSSRLPATGYHPPAALPSKIDKILRESIALLWSIYSVSMAHLQRIYSDVSLIQG